MPLRDGWGWHPPQTAFHIHIRHVQSVWGIAMLSRGHFSAPLYFYTGQVDPRFLILWSLVEWKWCHFIIVEAHIYLRLLPTSILDIYKVFEPLVCSLIGVWVQHYIIMLVPKRANSHYRQWTCQYAYWDQYPYWHFLGIHYQNCTKLHGTDSRKLPVLVMTSKEEVQY